MNSLIETIFQNFIVDDKKIPVSFMRYNGKKTTYITYMYYDSDNSFSGDDELPKFTVVSKLVGTNTSISTFLDEVSTD